MEVLSEYEHQLVQTLREDAKDVKDCYTKFSFQAMAFATTILGVIFRFQPEYPYIALASIASIGLLLTVTWIGCYKYSSSNRHFGYELHLFRTKNMQDEQGNGWKKYMREIGWEEAMRAWRIVQVTVFGKLYETRMLRPKRLKKSSKPVHGYAWFDLKALVEKETKGAAEYHAGSYLDSMNNALFALAGLSVIPLGFMAYQIHVSGVFKPIGNWLVWIGVIVVALAIIWIFILDDTRRTNLESGLSSIRSCAIVWQAVVVAHYRALNQSEGFEHYTKHLALHANDLADNVYETHRWVKNWDGSTNLEE